MTLTCSALSHTLKFWWLLQVAGRGGSGRRIPGAGRV